jgi:hypothetical protein
MTTSIRSRWSFGKYPVNSIVLNRFFAPAVQEGFVLIENHIGAYTFNTKVVKVTNGTDGLDLLMYKRIIRLAVVSQRKCTIAPGLLFDKLSLHYKSLH